MEEKNPFAAEIGKSDEQRELKLESLQAGDQLMINTASRIYALEVLEPAAQGIYARLARGKKTEATGAVETWIEDNDLVEIVGICFRLDPMNEAAPVVDAESGVLRVGSRAWYKVDRRNLNRRINVVTGIIESILYKP